MSADARRGRTLAVTGGIACGKSTVGSLLRGHDFDVLEADDVAHRLMQPGRRTYRRIVAAFGPAILDQRGRISRRVLGRIVFTDEGQRSRLNGLVHPIVQRVCRCWTRQRKVAGRDLAVIVPLLYETGMEDEGWDEIWCVRAPPATVLERLGARGLDPQECASRVAAQWPLEIKARKAAVVIDNDGSPAVLSHRVAQRLQALDMEKGETQR